MQTKDKVVCLFGGTGFIGHHIVQVLAREGYRIKILSRVPESGYELKTYGAVGQIVSCPCNYNDEKSIQQAVSGAYACVNLVGILFEKGKNTFQKAHCDLPAKIAKACKTEKVKKLIHISALAVDKAQSKYAKSKIQGEKAVHAIFPAATILRPSVVFGAGDSFFNMFAKLSLFLPALPLIGGGKTKFQPVFVGDIADAVQRIVADNGDGSAGKIYELGGPEIVSFKEIYERLLKAINRQRALVHVPFFVAGIQGAVMSLIPKPLLTADQVKSLRTDNIVSAGAFTFGDLGIEPTAMGAILPTYLSCFKRGGRFADKKAA